MQVFVTGASGWIGSAVVREFVGAGHRVRGLARSEASAAALAAAGAEVVPGALQDLDRLREAATAADGVIHLAFDHRVAFTGDFQGAADADRAAVDTFGDALAGSDKPFVVASGVLGRTPGRVATERDQDDLREGSTIPAGIRTRMQTAQRVLELAPRGVRSSLVRLAPTVHGDGDHGLLATVVAIARQHGVSGYIGDGANRWPAVHRDDAARLFVLALEKASPGSTLHGVADQGVPIRDVAAVIARHLHVPLASIPPDQAAAHFTWLAGFLAVDSPVSSALTREWLGWRPTGPGLLEDLEQGHYFRA